MALDQLPSSAALETLRLAIGHAMVQLPATAVFSSLTDLSLERMAVSIDGGQLLTRFLSPACCPRLKKLRMRKLRLKHAGMDKSLLSLEAGELSELSLESMEDPLCLELRTPNLRILQIACSSIEELAVYSAPRLEILKFPDQLPDRVDVVDGELPRLRILRIVRLRSHSCYYDIIAPELLNDDAIHLLQCCKSVRRLHVSLNIPKKIEQVSDIIKGRIPHLPTVTILTVTIFLYELHSSGDGLADILTQCNNLKYLCLDFKYYIVTQKNLGLDLTCHHQDHWKSQEISLAHLKEVEFKGLRGTDCELWLMQSVISSARDLQKLAVSFSPNYRSEDRSEAFDITSLVGDGVWTDCHGACLSYKWRPYL
ncbi:unnamed protein product [Urochloa decumbens]|uniref:F-box/LRR-repeat protein 15/At3g58940/PEG3-like LRR domain-containing protein n=1 Tax=Urochloa decumbens TaxID=240449 RepID=A0ABC9D1Z2_9POAL